MDLGAKPQYRGPDEALVTAALTATAVNYGERWRTSADDQPSTCIQGERRRTMANAGGRKTAVLKTTKVQAFGGSNPSPSASGLFEGAARDRLNTKTG